MQFVIARTNRCGYPMVYLGEDESDGACWGRKHVKSIEDAEVFTFPTLAALFEETKGRLLPASELLTLDSYPYKVLPVKVMTREVRVLDITAKE